MTQVRWTPELIGKLRSMIANGSTYAEAGEYFGVTGKWVGRVIRGDDRAPRSRIVIIGAPGDSRVVANRAKGCQWPSGDPSREMHICCRAEPQVLACDADAG